MAVRSSAAATSPPSEESAWTPFKPLCATVLSLIVARTLVPGAAFKRIPVRLLSRRARSRTTCALAPDPDGTTMMPPPPFVTEPLLAIKLSDTTSLAVRPEVGETLIPMPSKPKGPPEKPVIVLFSTIKVPVPGNMEMPLPPAPTPRIVMLRSVTTTLALSPTVTAIPAPTLTIDPPLQSIVIDLSPTMKGPNGPESRHLTSPPAVVLLAANPMVAHESTLVHGLASLPVDETKVTFSA